MKYDEEMLENMAEKINLVDYAANTCELRKSGANYYTSCFVHNEKTPSLCIFPDTNSWYCFGCGAGGSIYKWIMCQDKISFDDAVKRVAELTNTDVNSLGESDTVKVFKTLKTCNYGKKPIENREILDFQADYINKYKEFIPHEWTDEGIPADVLTKFNIRIDPESNRIVYPLFDSKGNYLAAKGRSRLDMDTIKILKIPKYITLGKIGTVDFFCGMKENYENIKKKNKIIIFEGIKSVMHVIPWGYDYGVSSETSHLNDEQIKILIKLGVSEVIIAYDKNVTLKEVIQQVNLLKRFTKVSVIIDKKNYLGEKDSPCDKGKIIFDELYNERIFL